MWTKILIFAGRSRVWYIGLVPNRGGDVVLGGWVLGLHLKQSSNDGLLGCHHVSGNHQLPDILPSC